MGDAERRFGKDLATTYSRGTYRATTIGKAVFDGRVRDGIGSDHSFMVTKNWNHPQARPARLTLIEHGALSIFYWSLNRRAMADEKCSMPSAQ
jgi:hypothetical protein